MESSVGASIKSLLFATIIDFWWHNVRIVGSVATSFWLFFFIFCSHSLQIYFFCLVFINNIICNILKKVFYISTSNYIKKHCDFFLIICFLRVNSLVVFVQKTYPTHISWMLKMLKWSRFVRLHKMYRSSCNCISLAVYVFLILETAEDRNFSICYFEVR